MRSCLMMLIHSIATFLFGSVSIRDDSRNTYVIKLFGELVTNFVSEFFSHGSVNIYSDHSNSVITISIYAHEIKEDFVRNIILF